MSVTSHEKYELFLQILLDNAKFERVGGKVRIPQDDFFEHGLKLNDTRRFFNKAWRDKVLMKRVLFTPRTTTPSPKIQFKDKPESKDDLPWYEVELDEERVREFIGENLEENSVSTDLKFEEQTGLIKFGNKTCKLPLRKKEYYVVKKLFEKPFGTRIPEAEIAEEFDRFSNGHGRWIYDAMLRTNKRIKKYLGIEKLIEYESANYWINLN